MRTIQRAFEDRPAVRAAVPLLVGLFGPSGSGKTFSALRLATGIQSVTGGDIWGIDTEAGRMLHYADQFRFRHVPFAPPFSSLDYLAVIEHCVKKGARIIVTDSMSHEHEGEGGHLERHEQEVDRLLAAAEERGRSPSRDAYNMKAWITVKAERARMIQRILQLGVTIVACFRAKEKIKPQKGGEPKELGWMPIAGEELYYEMTLNCMLPPASGGVPTWNSDQPGTKVAMKLPIQFRELLLGKNEPLSESIGIALARWAAGDEAVAAAQATENAAVDTVVARITSLGENGSGDELQRYIDGEVAPRYPAKGRHGPRIGAAIDAAWAKINARAAKPSKKPNTGAGAAPKGALSVERRALIAEQAGLTYEAVVAIERLSGGGDSESVIAAAVVGEGHHADQVQVADVLAALRKG